MRLSASPDRHALWAATLLGLLAGLGAILVLALAASASCRGDGPTSPRGDAAASTP